MFFKQSGYKPRPRTGSSSSQTSSTSGSPPKDETKMAGQNNANSETTSFGAADRRRASAGSDKFAGLTAHRNGQDERRAGWADQKPGQPGILGGMWASFTKGK
ncbi:hypothetical protein A1O1_01346 [Capronia coronata CBS 617.96]|uniref:Uncharacterized protein n=1 Tax=Capronia coronata CBS 617.96 TaxID=1182541 RepID=W9Z2M9_9EURO|nr:uncharacterized protein A1O1_01346 [Capronia coronata CBS 617.96]EXJ96220.1 hypothetical protein A1O1_01346 [Capronia coronata CBS 617.96]